MREAYARPTLVGVADAILIYDADCGFCRWCTARVLGWDRARRLRPVALQDAEADGHLAAMSRTEAYASWHLVTADGRVRSGGAAAPALLRMLPGGSILARGLDRSPERTERLYHWGAERRCRWGKVVTRGAKRRAQRRIEQRAASSAR